jgi:hypothetical protein
VGGNVVQSNFRCVASQEPLVRLLPPALPLLLLLLPLLLLLLLLLESDRCVMVEPLDKLVKAAVTPTSTVSCRSRCRRRIIFSQRLCVYVLRTAPLLQVLVDAGVRLSVGEAYDDAVSAKAEL